MDTNILTRSRTVPQAALTIGTIEYLDTGGDGPVLVLLHGVNMDASVWRNVVRELGPDFRCISPTLPLGAHRQAMDHPEQVTHRGVSAMVGEFLEALDLHDVTLVLNDWGGAQFLIADGPTDRISALALVACEAFDNFPPGQPGQAIATAARVPAALWLAMQMQRFQWFRRAPGAWGWMSKRPIPKAVMDAWFEPARTDPAVRRDLRTFALSTPTESELDALPERLRSFDRPVLVVWAPEDKLMPREHGPRLTELFPRGHLVEIEDSYTLVPEDQPGQLAEALAQFVASARH
jgi:pimeloyl-ACP methyl ester carboxylesterase